MKRLLFFFMMILGSYKGFSQSKDVLQTDQVWSQYTFLGKVSAKRSVYFDFVDRFNSAFKSQNTIFLRPAVAYDLNEQVSVYLGYCYAITYPTDSSPVKLAEQRPWQQILINNKVGKFSFQHRYRLEERFNQEYKNQEIEEGYIFTWRFRYKLNVQYSLWKAKDENKTFNILFSDELITSFGKNVSVSYFNQNRFFVGFSMQVKSTNIALGYTNIFRSTNAAGHYVDINAPTINISQKLDLRKNKK